MKITFCVLFSIFCILCFAQKEFQPKNSEIIESVEGDLDGDKILEKVLVYNTTDTTDLGNIREIQILKKVNGNWTVLEKSRNAVLEKNAGGLMGDPYQSTAIRNGILIIEHYGGSSWKWEVTDKYRFQNGHFELVGFSSSYGKPEEYFTSLDFNLSTGKIIYKKEVENTSEYGQSKNETFIKKGLKINLQNRNKKQQEKIVLPKTKEVIYL